MWHSRPRLWPRSSRRRRRITAGAAVLQDLGNTTLRHYPSLPLFSSLPFQMNRLRNTESLSAVSEAASRGVASSFGHLARRLADWTTKGLFSALVLVAGLGFGRQVIQQWRGNPPAAPGRAAPDRHAGRQPVQLVMGDMPYRFGRQTVLGDRADAARALRAACRECIASASPWSPTPNADEQRLLARLAHGTEFRPFSSSREPKRNEASPTTETELPAGAQLYESAFGAPLMVGTRRVDTAADQRGRAVEPQPRVVLWGVAAPRDEGVWTLFLLQADHPPADDAPPLPPGCHRLMSMARGGEQICAFQGDGECRQYQRFYTQWQAEHWPRATLRWRQSGGGWQASLVRSHGGSGGRSWAGQAEGDHEPGSCLIQLTPGRFGGSTGLVFVTP